MIDDKKVQDVLSCYKKDFVNKQWQEEKYKWEAIKNFQDNWNINSDDFVGMLKRSLSKTKNLLVSQNYFPARMIEVYAQIAPNEVKEMFVSLYDEGKDVVERIDNFKNAADNLCDKISNKTENHYQSENAISIYLWLRYPDKYYIYKYGVVRDVASKLDTDLKFTKGHNSNNLRNFYELYDELCKKVNADDELKNMLNSQLTDDCYKDANLKTLTSDIGFYISKCYQGQNNPLETTNKTKELYSCEQFLDDVYISEEKYNRLKSVLLNKKNIILQGAPGVGKTFVAKRLAYSIMGEKDDSRIEFVQFHQNYSYEDFVMGYKPEGNSFELKYGIFYRFCQKATNNPNKDYFFIIDEINRGNMSKIFGELLMLIEKDYRGRNATLAYNGLSFSVPKNLYIIGMMNTADRSLAMIDYALRRRFSFFDMEPAFNSEGFIKYKKNLNNKTFNLLIEKIVELNNEIMNDKSLGKGFCIGHSYFCGETECTTEWMMDVVDFDIIPMLAEYWFDDLSKVEHWKNILHGVF